MGETFRQNDSVEKLRRNRLLRFRTHHAKQRIPSFSPQKSYCDRLGRVSELKNRILHNFGEMSGNLVGIACEFGGNYPGILGELSVSFC